MADLVGIRRALLSVSDKTDLVPFARSLLSHGVELISTGGTARALSQAGLSVTSFEQLTGFPEMLDGRVKTLHPMVHAGILALRDKPEHTDALDRHGIKPIDLVCVNLYPFEQTVARPDATPEEAVENIDIGGPSMIRSAAKNAAWVTVVTAPSQYDQVVRELDANNGATSRQLRAQLASAAFSRTSAYDAAISAYFHRSAPIAFPPTLRLTYTRIDTLRYGENPHQSAALYADPASTGPSIVRSQQLGGKQLSYNNILDASAALELVKVLRTTQPGRCAACVVKHTNPCGAAVADANVDAIRLAIAGDPLAAYGGIMALNHAVTLHDAQAITDAGSFFEVIVAPAFDPDAGSLLNDRWKNVRLLACGDREGSHHRKLDYRSVPGGMLVQDRDCRAIFTEQWSHCAGPAPSPADLAAGAFLCACARALSSNAIAIGGVDGPGIRLFGAGAGQMDRVASCRIAIAKSADKARGAIAASDAFFPFADGPQLLIDAGVQMVIHPGGSKRDDDTFALCDKHGVTCLVTGERHFRH
ncbi:MAG: bifunctional phosphoribosylaminoimidazolecarboxamide formyltransferase/IMP cyclohydrolase PurH [Leptolyngbya sp. PLA3]|nr:MAG: bifunctional phosphoribosylaminoimidazolecarboxamide formyltransferase/IMP cyclohydrolase PurH [Cyanobacteria bacterium CYA]MCE7969055.1 bifunctional phosphoribosylaminoimidazolecarboxamide formyltransferase/IMP cyclohydrolase PurH [Leptolyngbya sp. PL-A3]